MHRNVDPLMQLVQGKPPIVVKSQNKKDWNLIIGHFLGDLHFEIDSARQKKFLPVVQGYIFIKREILKMARFRVLAMPTSNYAAEEIFHQHRLKIFFQNDENSRELIKYFSCIIRTATDQLVAEHRNQLLESYKRVLIRIYEYWQQEGFKRTYEYVILFFKDDYREIFARANRNSKKYDEKSIFQLEINEAVFDEIIQWGKQKDRENKSCCDISFKASVISMPIIVGFLCVTEIFEIRWAAFLAIPLFLILYTKIMNSQYIPVLKYNRLVAEEMRDLENKLDLKLDKTQDQVSLKIRLQRSTNHNPFATHVSSQGTSPFKFFTMLMGGRADVAKEEMKNLSAFTTSTSNSDSQESKEIKIDTRRRRLPVTEVPKREGEYYLFTEGKATHYYGIISEKLAENKKIDVGIFISALEKGWDDKRHTSGVYSLKKHPNGYQLEIRPEGRTAGRMFANECRKNGDGTFTYIFGIHDPTHKLSRIKKRAPHNPVIISAATPSFSPQ